MDLYILDRSFSKVDLCDDYISLIWTERYNKFGDVEINLKSTFTNRARFPIGSYLSIVESVRVMIVETVEDKVNDDGTVILVIKGRSLEVILEDRVIYNRFGALDKEKPAWTITGTAASIARQMFQSVCIEGIMTPLDIIPGVSTTSIFPADTIPEPSTIITHEQEIAELYAALEKFCMDYDLGFRLVRAPDSSNLYFNIYSGVNRTSQQSDLTPIIFSPELDNVKNTSELTSAQGVKNTAYVFSTRGSMVVYAPLVDPEVSGFERRVILVKAEVPEDTESTPAVVDNIATTNVDESKPAKPGIVVDVAAILKKAGEEALAAAAGYRMFDGEIVFGKNLVYGVDFNLGDLVELRNKDGDLTFKRVTEYIFSSDSENGYKAYPTLTQTLLAAATTWSTVEPTAVWDSYTSQVWSDV